MIINAEQTSPCLDKFVRFVPEQSPRTEWKRNAFINIVGSALDQTNIVQIQLRRLTFDTTSR